MRRALSCALAVSAFAGLLVAPTVGAAEGQSTSYVVVYESGASAKAAHAAVKAAGGRLVRETKAIGVATVVSSNPRFVADVSRKNAIYGAAHDTPIGSATPDFRPK